MLEAIDEHGAARRAVIAGDQSLTYGALVRAADAFGAAITGLARIAIIAEPSLETIVAIVGALRAGIAVVPINPSAGPTERDHILSDCVPDRVIVGADVDLAASGARAATPPADAITALIVYTSGTTGPPKGVVLSHGAVRSNVEAPATLLNTK